MGNFDKVENWKMIMEMVRSIDLTGTNEGVALFMGAAGGTILSLLERVQELEGQVETLRRNPSNLGPFAGPTGVGGLPACPQCEHIWKSTSDEQTCPAGIGGGELCGCPGGFHHQ